LATISQVLAAPIEMRCTRIAPAGIHSGKMASNS
jgi:hypothetical protein